ncbi:MAG: hypothetical protein K5829_10500 [Treponema sp.]|nr:hypothetical protein [Treponema sp.]
MATKTTNVIINESTLLTRKGVCDVLHIGLSTLDASEEFKNLKRVRIGRHTFFLREDVMRFILNHRDGGQE